MPISNHDSELLEAALVGFQLQRDEIERKIDELRSRLGGQTGSTQSRSLGGSQRRTLSDSARRRIALAQKKRWAAYKAHNGKPAGSKPKKRVLSAEGRARIVAATKKRWAAFRKAQKAS